MTLFMQPIQFLSIIELCQALCHVFEYFLFYLGIRLFLLSSVFSCFMFPNQFHLLLVPDVLHLCVSLFPDYFSPTPARLCCQIVLYPAGSTVHQQCTWGFYTWFRLEFNPRPSSFPFQFYCSCKVNKRKTIRDKVTLCRTPAFTFSLTFLYVAAISQCK